MTVHEEKMMTSSYDVTINVHADRSTGPYRPLWNWFGYDEPNYTYSAARQEAPEGARRAQPRRRRACATHNLLTSGDGTPALKWGSTNAYTEDADGNPVYDWTIMDQIFDAYVEAGNVPLIQIGFTPEALSDYRRPLPASAGQPADNTTTITTGWAAPPNDLEKWGGLVEAWARHLADRYGEDEVATWPWEVLERARRPLLDRHDPRVLRDVRRQRPRR